MKTLTLKSLIALSSLCSHQTFQFHSVSNIIIEHRHPKLPKHSKHFLISTLQSTMNPQAALKLFQKRHSLYQKPFNAFVALAKPQDLEMDILHSDMAYANDSQTELSGMPIAIKEVIDVANFPTTLCDPSLKKGFASALYTRAKSKEQEAELVTRLKQAGVTVVGKTNIPLKGLDVQCSNPIHGTTNNPWDAMRTPGGSSGGSCVAVATGMVPLALGTDLAGSLRIPASFCGVASMRASYGVIPRSGHQPPAAPKRDTEAESSLQLGPIAKDVATLHKFFKGTKLLNIPETKEEDMMSRKLNIAVSTGLGGMECDLLIKQYMEKEELLWHKHKVTNVTKEAHENLNLKEIGGTYMTYAKRYFVEMNGRANEKALNRADASRNTLRSTIDDIIGDNDFWMLPTCPVGIAFPHNPTQGRMPYSSLNEENEVVTKQLPYWPLTLTYVMPFTITGHPIVTMPIGTLKFFLKLQKERESML